MIEVIFTLLIWSSGREEKDLGWCFENSVELEIEIVLKHLNGHISSFKDVIGRFEKKLKNYFQIDQSHS